MFRKTMLSMVCLLVISTALVAQDASPQKLSASSVVLLAATDGRVYASGDATSERGDRSEETRNHFLPVDGLKEIDSVYLHHDWTDRAAALDRQGRVWVWGHAWTETLHGGDNAEKSVQPTHVPELDGAESLALGSQHLIVIDKNRRVQTFPTISCDNETGFLGAGDTKSHRGVISVKGIEDAVQVAANGETSFVLRADGSVWGMGSGGMGLLGRNARQANFLEFEDNSKNANPQPIQIQGLRDIKAISISGRFGLALDKAGNVWGWGVNDSGQLGSVADDLARLPPTRMRGLKPCTAIAAGYDFMLALQTDGTVMAQGCNIYGALGDKRGELEGRLRQVKLPAAAKSIYAGQYNAFAELIDGEIFGWGANDPSVGGFHPRALFSSIPPTQLDVDMRPKPAKAGTVPLVVYREGDIEEPEQLEVFIKDESVGMLTINKRQAIDEFKLEIPEGVHGYRIKSVDSEGSRADRQGVIVVSSGAMQNRFRKSVNENGLIAAVETLKKRINDAVPGVIPSTLDLKSDGPVSEETLQRIEARLGKPLPKSYRKALKSIGPFRLGPANAEVPLVALYAPDPTWTVGKWMDKAVNSVKRGSEDPWIRERNEEIDFYSQSFDMPGGQRLRQQKLLIGAVAGYEPYFLAPDLPACDDGSMSQLWPDFFLTDIESGEEWPSFGWINERDCDLVMLDKLVDAVEGYVWGAYGSSGVAFVAGSESGTVQQARVVPLDDESGFGIDSDGWFDD